MKKHKKRIKNSSGKFGKYQAAQKCDKKNYNKSELAHISYNHANIISRSDIDESTDLFKYGYRNRAKNLINIDKKKFENSVKSYLNFTLGRYEYLEYNFSSAIDFFENDLRNTFNIQSYIYIIHVFRSKGDYIEAFNTLEVAKSHGINTAELLIIEMILLTDLCQYSDAYAIYQNLKNSYVDSFLVNKYDLDYIESLLSYQLGFISDQEAFENKKLSCFITGENPSLIKISKKNKNYSSANNLDGKFYNNVNLNELKDIFFEECENTTAIKQNQLDSFVIDAPEKIALFDNEESSKFIVYTLPNTYVPMSMYPIDSTQNFDKEKVKSR